MNTFDCIFTRRSVRSFKPDDVDDKYIGLMLYAATYAPSAGNSQEWQFVVIKDELKRKQLAEAAFKQDFIAEAPVCIVVAADLDKASMKYDKRGEVLYSLQATANATMIMLLAAHELGLGTCWIGAFDEDKVSHIAELPSNLRPVVIVPVGYANEVPEMQERVPFENRTSFNGYNKKFDIAYSIQPDVERETRIKPVGNALEDFIKELVKKIKAMKIEGYSYTNGKGEKYWLHDVKGIHGVKLFFFSKNPRGSINMPEEFKVFENKNSGLPMLKKR